MTLHRLYLSVSQLHENPRLIAFAATPAGRAAVWLVATLLLAPSHKVYALSPLLALVLMAPQWRVQILSLGSIWAFYDIMTQEGLEHPAGLAGLAVFTIAVLYLCYLGARSYDRLPALIRRNSQIVLHLLMLIVLASTWLGPGWTFSSASEPGSTAAALRYLLVFLVWRCGYILLSGRRGSAARSGFLDHLFYSLPAFGGTSIPYGKGYDHLVRHRADEPEARARAALAGIKLLVLAWIMTALRIAIVVLVYGDDLHGLRDKVAAYALDVPRLGEIIAAPDSVGLPLTWLSMFLELVLLTITFASWGHTVIGCLRLFGYNVFRNTYKPLLATSIVDFWNRFYYYFKELLVEFFFFPTYVSVFKSWPRLRMFAAVMAAALVGNVYYHVLTGIDDLVAAGLGGAVARVGPRSFYCFLLGLGIFISMIREQGRRGRAPAASVSALSSLRRIAGVWLFYAVIHIWNVKPMTLTFTQRTTFFLSLLGL